MLIWFDERPRRHEEMKPDKTRSIIVGKATHMSGRLINFLPLSVSHFAVEQFHRHHERMETEQDFFVALWRCSC